MPAPHRVSVLVPALLAALLAACQTNVPAPASVTGGVIFPPAAGQAVFSGIIDGQETDLAQAQVGADGRFTVLLGVPGRLPSQGTVGTLVPQLLDLPGGFSNLACQGKTAISDPQARLVVLSGGRYLVGGQVTGTLTPGATILSNQEPQETAAAQSLLVTALRHVYTDRDVTLTGTLDCTLKSPQNPSVPASVKINYTLLRGWNALENRLEQASTGSGMTINLGSKQVAGGMVWLYQPATP